MYPGWQQRLWRTLALLAVMAAWGILIWLANRCPADAGLAPAGCVEFWFNRYQTLIAALTAIIAAFIAAWPVWKQLNVMSVQATAALHEVVSDRAVTLAARAEATQKTLREFGLKLTNGYLEREGTNLSHWIWDMEGFAIHQRTFLRQQASENIDGTETTKARRELLDCLEGLIDCMSDMNDSVRLDLYGNDPEEEQPSPEAIAKAEARSRDAEKAFPKHVENTARAIGNLRRAFARDLDEIRTKRQKLSNTLIASELQK